MKRKHRDKKRWTLCVGSRRKQTPRANPQSSFGSEILDDRFRKPQMYVPHRLPVVGAIVGEHVEHDDAASGFEDAAELGEDAV